MSIRPLPGFVLVEPIPEDNKTSSGLYKSENQVDKPMKGEIISVGDSFIEGIDIKLERIKEHELFSLINSLVVGQTVIYKKWTNQEVDHEGKKYLLIPFDQLMAVIE